VLLYVLVEPSQPFLEWFCYRERFFLKSQTMRMPVALIAHDLRIGSGTRKFNIEIIPDLRIHDIQNRAAPAPDILVRKLDKLTEIRRLLSVQ
jgi:hypothetical protein